MAFVHLHNHSEFSMLDGATRIKDILNRAVEFGMPAVALTDHGYMYGIPDLCLGAEKINKDQADFKQWALDSKNVAGGGEPICPKQDAQEHERRFSQYQRDVEALKVGDLKRAKPAPLIKPICGCEVYFTPDNELSRDKKPELYHMILLAKNEVGYINLMKIVSDAATRGFYYKPRVCYDTLKAHSEGLICTSACVAGIIPRKIMQGLPQDALYWANTFKETFAPGDFYIEIQNHGLEVVQGWSDNKLSHTLADFATNLDLKVIATNDFHYLRRSDAFTQDIVECIGTGKKLEDTDRIKMARTESGEGEFYMKSEDEMRQLFSWIPEAIDNTVEVANKCNFEMDLSHLYLPKFPGLKDGETADERLRKECESGLTKKYGVGWEEKSIAGVNIKERFEHEFEVISKKGFSDYFLIVQEYVQWAKQNGIGVGPGRGSAAGAIIAYATDITSLEPLENGLMFERFLSMERTEMPDIDLDFDDDRRYDVIQHVRELYGSDRVCRVITYSTIKAKNALADSARVLGIEIPFKDRLSKMIPEQDTTLTWALTKTPGKEDYFHQEFANEYNSDPKAKKLLDTARSIEGLIRGESVHACAVLIAPTAVNDHVPTKLDTKGGIEITQYEGHTIADMGLLKMDFLGLRNLTVMSRALENIRNNYSDQAAIDAAPESVKSAIKDGATCIDIDLDKIPFDDKEIFKLLSSGKTAGVFQVESAGMTATIKNMKPTEYKHIVALIALYRPGPLGAGMATSYTNRMNGKEPIVFYDDRLSDILNETYGTMVYQEQVMQISIKMCGFSAGESDSRIRKPVAKKKIKLLTSEMFSWEDGAYETTYDHWMNGAIKRGYKRDVALRIWNDVLEFASYAFNKSHSAAYAIIVMQTAWLKAHFTLEFMAAVLTSYVGKTEKITHYINSCKREGIALLPPDVNESNTEFTAVKDGIRFGLSGIKGVGEAAAELIIKEREEKGPFKHLFDYLDRANSTTANRRIVDALIKAGAFDFSGYPRHQLSQLINKDNPNNILDPAVKRIREKGESGQMSFADLFADDEEDIFSEIPEPSKDEWDRSTKLQFEREVIGIYVSDHPLSPYKDILDSARTYSIQEVLEGARVINKDGTEAIKTVGEKEKIWIAGMIKSIKKLTTKKGDAMATLRLEDMEAEIEVVVFPKTYETCADILAGDGTGDVFIRIEGHVDRGDRGDQFMATKVEALDVSGSVGQSHLLEIHVSSRMLTREFLSNIQQTLNNYPGNDHVLMLMEQSDGKSMKIEIPTLIDSSNVVLFATLQKLLQDSGTLELV